MRKIRLILLSFCLLGLRPSYAQNNALHFDGDDDFVTLNGLAPQLAGDPSFTIEFWMRADRTDQADVPVVLFAINNDAGLPNENVLGIQMGSTLGPNNGILLVGWGDGSWPDGASVSTGAQIGDNVCHHIAYTRAATGA